jgi:hypothetical protein
MPSIWDVLGIAPTNDERSIRRAYSAGLKLTNPEDHPEDFKILRAAYEEAMKLAAAPQAVAPAETAAIATPQPAAPIAPKAPAAPVLDEHQALCAKLQKLIAKAAEKTEMSAVLDAIFASPSFQRIDVQARTEIWLLRLIAFNAPRSDPLIPQGIATFGWSDGAGSREIAQLTRQIFQRARDLQAREAMAQPSSAHHRAFIALTQPYKRPGFLERANVRGIYWQVRQCLNFIRRAHPTLMQDLNKQSLASWQAELNKTRLSAEGWMALLASPPGILLYVLGESHVQTENFEYLGLLLIPVPVFVCAFLHMAAWKMLRRLWRERWRHAAPSWVAWGWAPALILVLFLAALAPDSLAGFAVAAGLGLLAGAWVILTAEPDPRLSRPKGGLALTLFHAPVIMLCGFTVQLMPGLKFGALFVPGCIATLAFGAGNGALTRLWFTLSSVAKQRLMIGISAAVLAACTLTWNEISFPALAPLAISATLCVALITIVPAWELPPRVINWRYRIRVPVIIMAWIAAANGVVVAPYLSIFLLTWAAWTCGFHLTRSPSPKRLPLWR